MEPLRTVIHHVETGLQPLLDDWLAGVYLAPTESEIDDLCSRLKPGEMLVNASGDVYTRHSVALHAAQSALHGVLERQRELAELRGRLPQLQQQLVERNKHVEQAEQALQQNRLTAQQRQQALQAATQSQHDLNLEIQRLQQQRQHVLDRRSTAEREQLDLSKRLAHLQIEHQQKQQSVAALGEALPRLKTQLAQAQAARHTADAALNRARQTIGTAERLAQEKSFNKKLISSNINEINNRFHLMDEEKKNLLQRQNETEAMLQATRMETLKGNLEQALTLKQQREAELAAARDGLTGAEQSLQEHERMRLQTEQLLHPMRDKLEQARLQEQQARLLFESCQQGLAAMGLDETVLTQGLSLTAKAGEIERAGVALQTQIDELGPVNLAAIQELVSERERKSYLDSQAADLEQAVATLDDAIRRIDRETRSRLQHTFDEANRNFGELFGSLFGGGNARLELLGEEILDTGMQVFAQPPGKKNSTIHLLSGGEKALTALALVFALFRLNPAPFCLMDEVDAPLDDSNTERFCNLVKKMSERTQFLFVSHNKITMELAQQLIGVTMQESGVSRIVEVDIEAALQMNNEVLV
jgi:chromosome segregation protein